MSDKPDPVQIFDIYRTEGDFYHIVRKVTTDEFPAFRIYVTIGSGPEAQPKAFDVCKALNRTFARVSPR
jgi:hypothetical protein